MISLTTLYDDYIERQNFLNKKKPVEYIVPPPLKWVGTIINICPTFLMLRALSIAPVRVVI